jgi:hypothetical protein
MSENQSIGGTVQEVDGDNGGFFGVFANKQSYLNIAYLLLSFPFGIFYFIFLMVGFSLGIGLSILGIGLVILLAMLIACSLGAPLRVAPDRRFAPEGLRDEFESGLGDHEVELQGGRARLFESRLITLREGRKRYPR